MDGLSCFTSMHCKLFRGQHTLRVTPHCKRESRTILDDLGTDRITGSYKKVA